MPMASRPRDRSINAARRQRVASESPAAVRPGCVPPTNALTRTARRNGTKYSGPIGPPRPRLKSRATPTVTAEASCHFRGDRWASISAWLPRRKECSRRIVGASNSLAARIRPGFPSPISSSISGSRSRKARAMMWTSPSLARTRQARASWSRRVPRATSSTSSSRKRPGRPGAQGGGSGRRVRSGSFARRGRDHGAKLRGCGGEHTGGAGLKARGGPEMRIRNGRLTSSTSVEFALHPSHHRPRCRHSSAHLTHPRVHSRHPIVAVRCRL